MLVSNAISYYVQITFNYMHSLKSSMETGHNSHVFVYNVIILILNHYTLKW